MTDLRWHELFPSRGLTLDAVTSFLRPLASRTRIGVRQRTPLVVFEQWASGGHTRYLIGVETPLGAAFIAQLVAVVPGLAAMPLTSSPRVRPRYGCDIRLTSLSASLRTDVATDISTAQDAAMATASNGALVVQWIIGPAHGRQHRPTPFQPLVQLGFATAPTPSAHDQTLWRQKTVEPLFAIRGRIGTTGNAGTLRGLRAAIQQADSAHGHLIIGPPSRRTAETIMTFKRRGWGGIVNGRELAALLAWPLDGGTYNSHRPIGTPPPTPSEGGRPLGISLHPASSGQTVVMPAGALSRHLLIIGPTGSGKSNLLARNALDDIDAGRAVVVMEPKGDLIDRILERIDPSVFDRLVVIEAGETVHPVGSNPLGGRPESAERQADEIVGIFRSLHGTAIGPRSTDVLLHALILAARTGGTLLDVTAILTNTTFRARAAALIDDPIVLGPWLAWFDNISDGERAQVVAPILNKLRGFTARASIRRLLGQADPGWTWDDMLNRRGVVMISLNRGVIGPEATTLLGTLLLGQLWGAVQRRTRIPEAQRQLATVIVDEWQLFTGGLDFADVLSTARGMGCSVTVANQNLAQLSPVLKAAVSANTRSKISFAPAKDDAATLAGLFGNTAVTEADLLGLAQFEAVGSVYGTPGAFHFRTEPLSSIRQPATVARAASQRRFGQPGGAVDDAVLARWNQPPTGGIGRVPRGGRP
jgi:hypothetical protein